MDLEFKGGAGQVSGDTYVQHGRSFVDKANGNQITYFTLSPTASSATPNDESKQNIFQINEVPPGKFVPNSSLIDLIGKGSDNTLILPGKENDYKVSVAGMTPADMSGYHQHGDINLARTTDDGHTETTRLHNIQRIVFADDLPQPPSIDMKVPKTVIAALDDGTIKTHSVPEIYNDAFSKLTPDEQCKQQAVEAAKGPIMDAVHKTMLSVEALDKQFVGLSQSCGPAEKSH